MHPIVVVLVLMLSEVLFIQNSIIMIISDFTTKKCIEQYKTKNKKISLK